MTTPLLWTEPFISFVCAVAMPTTQLTAGIATSAMIAPARCIRCMSPRCLARRLALEPGTIVAQTVHGRGLLLELRTAGSRQHALSV